MKDAQNPDHTNLGNLVSWLAEGRFVIPDFQREFEWAPWDIRDLMRSILLDYYIGNLLLWKGKAANIRSLSCEHIYGYESKQSQPEHIVLDGQQRLTAMYYAFHGPKVPLPNRASRALFYVDIEKFMGDDQNQDDAFQYVYWSSRIDKLLVETSLQYESHTFPLLVIGQGGWTLFEWINGYKDFWGARAANSEAAGDSVNALAARQYAEQGSEFGNLVRDTLAQYQVSYIELDEELAIDKVCDIFTQLNSKGIRLDVFDLMNALLKPRNVQLKRMWREAQDRLAFVQVSKMNVYILQVISILAQAYCSPKYLYYLLPGQARPLRHSDGTRGTEVLVQDDEDFRDRWKAAVQHLEDAIGLLRQPQQYGVVAARFLPYESILPVFAALQAKKNQLPPAAQLAAERKLRLWYWASVFLNRYSGSVESTSTRDFLDVSAWISGEGSEPPLIPEFKTRLAGVDLRSQVRSGSSIYNGIFNLLVVNGAKDWVTGNVPPSDDIHDHHIVPASWGVKNLDSQLFNSVLNRTPLTSKTNRDIIGDRLPNAYLPEWIEKSGEAAVRSVLSKHLISPAAFDILLRPDFNSSDFEEFVAERHRTILHTIEDLLLQERLDLPLDLRRLDQDIEDVELSIRQLIVQRLDSDESNLPEHIRTQMEGRLESTARKDPAFDLEHYESLGGFLEFADLRDLEVVITSKVTWARFNDTFPTKELVQQRFSQLADARNSIRHSRKLSEIARKEGEAAVLWFKGILPSESAASASSDSSSESIEAASKTSSSSLTAEVLTDEEFMESDNSTNIEPPRYIELPLVHPVIQPFIDSISVTSVEQHRGLRTLGSWAIELETQGVAKLHCNKDLRGRVSIRPYISGEDAGLVTLWNDNGASISFWRSVFARKSPDTLARLNLWSELESGNGNSTRNVNEELLRELTSAYFEASGRNSDQDVQSDLASQVEATVTLDVKRAVAQQLRDLVDSQPDILPDHHHGTTHIRFIPAALDSPALRQGFGWTPSRRMLLGELVNRPSGVSVAIVVGPGDQQIRQKLIEAAKKDESGLFAPLKGKTGVKWCLIYSRKLVSKQQLEELEGTELETAVKSSWQSFCDDDLPNIIETMSKLIAEIEALGITSDSAI